MSGRPLGHGRSPPLVDRRSVGSGLRQVACETGLSVVSGEQASQYE